MLLLLLQRPHLTVSPLPASSWTHRSLYCPILRFPIHHIASAHSRWCSVEPKTSLLPAYPFSPTIEITAISCRYPYGCYYYLFLFASAKVFLQKIEVYL